MTADAGNEVRPRKREGHVEGFWRATWRNRRGIFEWELWTALALAGCGWLFIDGKAVDKSLGTLLIASIGAAASLLGVIIAGLAIIAAFLSPEFLRVLAKTRGGIEGDFWPFWWVAAWSVVTILASACGLLLMVQTPCLRQGIFVATTFTTSYTLLAALSVVGFIVAQAGSRARQLLGESHEDRTG